MGEALFIVASLFAGLFLSRITKDELTKGERYFKLLCNLCLALFVFLILWNNFEYKIFIGIAIGLILGFFIFNPYLYLGILAAMTSFGFSKEIFTITSIIFSLSYMSMYNKQATIKFFIFYICLFLIPYAIISFSSSYQWLWYGISIGGFFHGVRENYKRD